MQKFLNLIYSTFPQNQTGNPQIKLKQKLKAALNMLVPIDNHVTYIALLLEKKDEEATVSMGDEITHFLDQKRCPFSLI